MEQVLVVGGGIAGPVAAMAFVAQGVDATVLESRSQRDVEDGQWLTLQANGIDALQAVDAHRLVEGVGFPTRSMRFHNARGRDLGTLPNGAPTSDGVVSHMVRRADLYRALRDEAVRRGVRVEYSARVTAARSDADRAEVTLADGRRLPADLVVGADGVRSVVRTAIDPAAPAARYVPVLNLGGHIPDLDTGAPLEEFQMMFGSRCFLGWTSTPEGGTVWFANPPRHTEPTRGELAAVTDAAWREELTRLFRGDHGPALDIVRAAPAPLVAWTTYDVPRVPRWHRDRLCLIGDAAHATSPSSGQGASLALEDAVILPLCLRDAPDVGTALARFDTVRRERVEKIVAHGHRSSTAKAAGPIGRIVRDAMLPLVFRMASRHDGAATRWITDHHVDPAASYGDVPARH